MEMLLIYQRIYLRILVIIFIGVCYLWLLAIEDMMELEGVRRRNILQERWLR
jgi:hypothetical protein